MRWPAARPIRSDRCVPAAAALLAPCSARCAVGPNFKKPAAPEVAATPPRRSPRDRRPRPASRAARRSASSAAPTSRPTGGRCSIPSRSNELIAPGARQQSRSQGRAGGTCSWRTRTRWRSAAPIYPQRRGRLLRQPPAATVGRAGAGAEQQRLPVQPVHAAGQRLLHARRVRAEPPHGGVGCGAGTGDAASR